MAHELSFHNGKAEMAYNAKNGKPWHELGTAVPGAMTVKEALVAAHLNWTVEKGPAFTHVNGEFIPAPEHFCVFRTDTNAVLGVVKGQYNCINNREAFSFIDYVLGEGSGQIDTAGALKGGETVWMLAEMPETMDVVKGDEVKKYLLVSTGHGGNATLKIMFTNVRVVCQNTMSFALGSASNMVSIKHTPNWEEEFDFAKEVLCHSNQYWDECKAICKKMADTSITRAEVGLFMEAMFPKEMDKERKRENRIKENEMVLQLMETGRGTDIPGVKGTWWGLYNAYVEYLEHMKPMRKGKNNWEFSQFGAGSKLRQNAFNYICEKVAA